ncbi:MAG: hypothetical protein JJ883_19265 [Thalassospira sp.]|uniref:hypothetical protein n=1 Tax=Thalassospira TaxID=168934 RepID=UPI0002872D13|nr:MULTISPECIES: hypothetical protein [Thalassospira]EKF07931.1 hypothetical protein TH2_10524 [Thalassospira profundimaris WP0211]MBO6842614.1 hypothetical protein [Thalassospira sp.]
MNGLLELIQEYGNWIYLLLFAYCALKSGALPLLPVSWKTRADIMVAESIAAEPA